MIEDLGVAVHGLPLSGAALAGRRVVVVTRNLAPTGVLEVDAERLALHAATSLPHGAGAWGVAAGRDGRVHLGLFGARGRENLWSLHAGALESAAQLDLDYVWALDVAPDGRVFGVGTPPLVFVYDPATRRAAALAVLDAAAGEVGRSVAVVGDRLVVGGSRGGRALLLTTTTSGADRRSALPGSLAGDAQVYVLARGIGPHAVVAGTIGPARGDPAVAAFDVVAPDAGRVVRLDREAVVDAVAASGRRVFAAARPSGGIYAVAADGALSRLAVPVPMSETRGLFLSAGGGSLVGASSTGALFRIDLGSLRTRVVAPSELGVPLRAQLPQSLAVGAGAVWVGGNSALERIDLSSAEQRRTLPMPGEVKDLVVVGGSVHCAVYPLAEVWRVEADGVPRRVAALPPDQLRPIAIAAEPALGLLAVTTTDDAERSALHLVDPVTARTTTLRDPLGPGQVTSGVAAADGLLFVGGSGARPALAALIPATGAVRWRVDDVAPAGGFLLGVVVAGGRVVTLSTRGELAAVDRATGRVIVRRRVGTSAGRMAAGGGEVRAVTAEAVLRIDPATLASEVLASGLSAEVWGWPPVAVDQAGAAYAIRRRSVVRVLRRPSA